MFYQKDSLQLVWHATYQKVYLKMVLVLLIKSKYKIIMIFFVAKV